MNKKTWRGLTLALIGFAVAAGAPRSMADSDYDALVKAQKAIEAANVAASTAAEARDREDAAQAKADNSHDKAVEARRVAEEAKTNAELAEKAEREAHDRWYEARSEKDAELAFKAMMTALEAWQAAEKTAKNKDRTSTEAWNEAYKDSDKAYGEHADAIVKKDLAQDALQKAQQAIDAVKNQPGKRKGLQQTLEDIHSRVDLLALGPRPPGSTAVATGTTPGQETASATLVGVVLPVGGAPGQPVSGSLVPDPDRYQDIPALRVITLGEVALQRDAGGQATLDGVVADVGDGRLQRADGPLTFLMPDRDRVRLTLTRPGSPTPLITRDVPLDRGVQSTTPRAVSGKAPVPEDYSTQPVCAHGSAQSIQGPLSGDSRRTSVTVDGLPARIVAETQTAAYYLLPDRIVPGLHELRLQVGRVVASFPICVLNLLMRADRLELLKGQSTAFQAVVSGPEKLPDAAWQRAGVPSDLVDVSNIRRLAPEFPIPGPGERARILLRIENLSRNTVSIRPSKNDVVVKTLEQQDFKQPYPFTGTIQSDKGRSGGFRINGLVVGFFAPIRGTRAMSRARFRYSLPESAKAQATSSTASAAALLHHWVDSMEQVFIDVSFFRAWADELREEAKQKKEKAEKERNPEKRKVLEEDAARAEQAADGLEQRAREEEVFQKDEGVVKARQKAEEAARQAWEAWDESERAGIRWQFQASGGMDLGLTGPEAEAKRKEAAAEAQREFKEKIDDLWKKRDAYSQASRELEEAEKSALKKALPR